MELFAEATISHNRWGYAALMGAALVAFVCVKKFQHVANQSKLESKSARLLLAWSAFVGGAIGGKIPFVFTEEQRFWALESWFADGKTITTGLMGAYLAVEGAKTLLGIRVQTGDTYALPLAIALSIGRLGCFFNGCCYGTFCSAPWAWDFGDGPRHPTQLYEMIFHASCATAMAIWPSLAWLHGHRLKLYLIAYCGFRFLTEWIRPEPSFIFQLTFYQCVTLSFAIGLLVQWWWQTRSTSMARIGPEYIDLE